MKKGVCLLLALYLLVWTVPVMALRSYTAEYDLNQGSVIIGAEGTYRVYQSGGGSTGHTITIRSNCSLVLDGVNILVPRPDSTYDYDKPNPLNIDGAYSVQLHLADGTVNNLQSEDGLDVGSPLRCGSGRAGLRVPAGASLTISGDSGVLNAYGAQGHNTGSGSAHAGGGAGIGGDGGASSRREDAGEASGSVTINGGVVNAMGRDPQGWWGGGGAGIGSGGAAYRYHSSTSGPITINGGTVTAGVMGVFGGSPLGAGADGGTQGTLSYHNSPSSCAPVQINGGTVVLNHHQNLKQNESLSVSIGATLVVAEGASLTLGGGSQVLNNGNVVNYGSIVNGGAFQNNGHLESMPPASITGNPVAGNDILTEHLWGDAPCTECRPCTVCGVPEDAPRGHRFQNGLCVVCQAPDPSYHPPVPDPDDPPAVPDPDDPPPMPEPDDPPAVPKTGDPHHPMLWLTLLGISAAGAAMPWLGRRSRGANPR